MPTRLPAAADCLFAGHDGLPVRRVHPHDHRLCAGRAGEAGAEVPRGAQDCQGGWVVARPAALGLWPGWVLVVEPQRWRQECRVSLKTPEACVHPPCTSPRLASCCLDWASSVRGAACHSRGARFQAVLVSLPLRAGPSHRAAALHPQGHVCRRLHLRAREAAPLLHRGHLRSRPAQVGSTAWHSAAQRSGVWSGSGMGQCSNQALMAV